MALDYISREKKLPAITPENYEDKSNRHSWCFSFRECEREGSKIHTSLSVRIHFFALWKLVKGRRVIATFNIKTWVQKWPRWTSPRGVFASISRPDTRLDSSLKFLNSHFLLANEQLIPSILHQVRLLLAVEREPEIWVKFLYVIYNWGIARAAQNLCSCASSPADASNFDSCGLNSTFLGRGRFVARR